MPKLVCRMLSGLILGWVTAAGAADPDPRNVSRATALIFREVCVAKAGNQAAMDAWLRLRLFQPAAPDVADRFAGGTPGRVWLSPERGLPSAVITREEGIFCQVMAPIADIEEAIRLFRDLTGLERPGLAIRTEEDRPVRIGDRTGHRILIRVGQPTLAEGGYLFALSVAPPRAGGAALLMTASRAAAAEPR
ncbi:MAG: hypothetical protein JWR00_1425 [Rubritepida sp.]|nr:hypothetical protein [Rubritepida sp.]